VADREHPLTVLVTRMRNRWKGAALPPGEAGLTAVVVDADDVEGLVTVTCVGCGRTARTLPDQVPPGKWAFCSPECVELAKEKIQRGELEP
jgi:hypothetical protein